MKTFTKFSKEENIRLPEIKGYVDKKIVQKKEFEDRIEQINIEVAALKENKSELEESRDMILEQNRRAEGEIKSYLSFKQELEKHGISMTYDIPKFARTVKTIAEYGYDPKRVLEEFLDIQYYQEKLREDQKHHKRLDSQNSSLLKRISLHSNKADLFNELDIVGFGIKELKRLLDTVMNIARSNQISHWHAIDKFFNDIETQYDAKLGFESEKDKLVTEIKMLEEERKKGLENLRNQPFIGPIVARAF